MHNQISSNIKKIIINVCHEDVSYDVIIFVVTLYNKKHFES